MKIVVDAARFRTAILSRPREDVLRLFIGRNAMTVTVKGEGGSRTTKARIVSKQAIAAVKGVPFKAKYLEGVVRAADKLDYDYVQIGIPNEGHHGGPWRFSLSREPQVSKSRYRTAKWTCCIMPRSF